MTIAMTTYTPKFAAPLFAAVSFALSMGSMALMTLAYWNLAALPGGDVWVGWVSSTALFTCMFLAPLVGSLIDSTSKRKLLATATLAVSMIVAVLVILPAHIGVFAAAIIGGQIYLSVFYPTQFAIIRENFAPATQPKLNVSIDIATQAAGLSSSIAFILLLATLAHSQTAFLILIVLVIGACGALFLQEKQQCGAPRPGFGETLRALPSLTRDYKQLIALALASRVPFIFVVTLEVAQPVHFQNNIGADLQQHTIVMLLYGLFSVIGGSLCPAILRRVSAETCLKTASYVFVGLSVLLFAVDTLWGFRVIVPCIAVVGTLIRIAGNQIMLAQSGNGVIGRISATLQILTYLIRFAAMLLLTLTLTLFSTEFVLLALVVVAIFGPAFLWIFHRWSLVS